MSPPRAIGFVVWILPHETTHQLCDEADLAEQIKGFVGRLVAFHTHGPIPAVEISPILPLPDWFEFSQHPASSPN